MQKGSQKLSARLYNFISIKKGKILTKSFIGFKFVNCPLIWMFQGRGVRSRLII